MNHFPTANSLQEIADAINEQRLLGRLFNPARISPTAGYWGQKEITTGEESKEFRPGAAKAFLVFGLVGSVLAALFLQPAMGQDPSWIRMMPLFSGLLFTGIILLIVRYVLPRFTIRLDRAGIAIDDAFIPWKGVRETAILRVRRGKSTKHSLVLWMKDGSYQLFDLSGFLRLRIGGFSGELSSYIEYFKHAQK